MCTPQIQQGRLVSCVSSPKVCWLRQGPYQGAHNLHRLAYCIEEQLPATDDQCRALGEGRLVTHTGVWQAWEA